MAFWGKILLTLGGTVLVLIISAWIGSGWGASNAVAAGTIVAVGAVILVAGGLLLIRSAR